ncbi:unnamed protein product [Polarella glacialis]|uniref:Uncharacterized protein n=1 Tax=Polarella glacialis TaxID=89957 RepID=A0A813EXM9_POLGL|nr:unnamed protein product [Polarella glacialis]
MSEQEADLWEPLPSLQLHPGGAGSQASEWQDELVGRLRAGRASTCTRPDPGLCQARPAGHPSASSTCPTRDHRPTLPDAIVAEVRRCFAPEASKQWCSIYVVLRAHSEKWTGAGVRGPCSDRNFCSLHMGSEAAASILALSHLLIAEKRLQQLRQKWRWRGVSENPHYEAGDDGPPQVWPSLEEALYSNFEANWFRTEDDTGRLASSTAWQGKQFWQWLGLGRPTAEVAQRLAHLVVASPPPGAASESGALLTFVTALGALRVGGSLFQRLHRPFSEPHLGALALLSSRLFEDAQLVMPSLSRAHAGGGLEDVYLVALKYRGAQPALLQALATAATDSDPSRRVTKLTLASTCCGAVGSTAQYLTKSKMQIQEAELPEQLELQWSPMELGL